MWVVPLLELGRLGEGAAAYVFWSWFVLFDLLIGVAAEEVVKVLDGAWLEVSPYAANYFH